MEPVSIIGAGLAGSELALQLADRGIPVRLFEMKPSSRTPAQSSDGFAELVCSTSFRSSSLTNAVGVIKEEMRILGGKLIQIADRARVPAGDALAVDRQRFSGWVTEAIRGASLIELREEVVSTLPEEGEVVVATGPLTHGPLADEIGRLSGDASKLYFYDAIAPIVDAASLDLSRAYFASRYGKGDARDYLNCPLDEQGYQAFVEGLLASDKVELHEFEEARFFEGCLPIEEIARRGRDALRFGCMKPVGLEHPETGRRPYAVVQLRAENVDRSAFNLVGFQTRMKWGEQLRIFRGIPGLERAEFLRMGQVHRNTYLDAPALLDSALRLRKRPHLRFAGQITGVEGYVESMASGLIVGLLVAAERLGVELPPLPETSAMGALLGHALGTRRATTASERHVPSNVHWGLFPPLDVRAGKGERRRLYGERALRDLRSWLARVSASSAGFFPGPAGT